MKKVFIMGMLIALSGVAWCQVSSTVRDLNVTGGLKLGSKSVIAISTDSSAGSKVGNYLITERAAKLYTDSRISSVSADTTLLFTKYQADTARINNWSAQQLLYNGKKEKSDTIGNTGYLPIWRNLANVKYGDSVANTGYLPLWRFKNQYLNSNDTLLFVTGNLSIGATTAAATNSLLLNNGRAEIQGSFTGLRFNVGSGLAGGGTYDATKGYLFQNRGNTYLQMTSTAITGGVNNADFYANVNINGLLKITGGTPGLSKVLTSDASGNATWQTPSAGGVSTVYGRSGTVTATSGDYTVAQVTGAAALASPTFTGFPAAPTQSTGTSNTTLATTAFVQNSLSAQVKDTAFITTASQSVLQVVTTAGKDSLGFKQQTANKFLASAISGTSDITARAIDVTDIPFAINTSTAQTIQGLKTVQGSTASNGGQLGAELSSTASGTNWAGTSFATGYTHTIGSVVALTGVFAPTTTNYYQLTVTTTGTAGSVLFTFGGYSSATLSFGSTITVAPQATTTGVMIVTPLTAFDGVVTVSIKLISTGTATQVWANGSATSNIELRASGVATNQFIGFGTGRNNTTGSNNTGEGYQALLNNTSGSFNTALGYQALFVNNIGGNNVALGTLCLQANTIGNQNIANGDQSLYFNTTGSQNTSIGFKSMMNSTTGGNNVAIGGSAGRFIADGVTSLVLANNSTFIGNGARALADNQANQLVIGYNAIGLGNNTTVIGNSTTTALGTWGNITLQGTTDKIILPSTVTAPGTTGAQTINKASGKVNFAATTSTMIVTNSLVTTASIIRVQVEGTDATAFYARVTPAAGSFVITLNATATAETKVSFIVFN
jgi:hypothetical protein